MNLWDSTQASSPRRQRRPNGKKSKSRFTPKPHETLENQHANPMLSPLWEDCDTFS
jgi:hypothetical protein